MSATSASRNGPSLSSARGIKATPLLDIVDKLAQVKARHLEVILLPFARILIGLGVVTAAAGVIMAGIALVKGGYLPQAQLGGALGLTGGILANLGGALERRQSPPAQKKAR